MYITPAQLADGADAIKDLAELYGVDPDLLALVIADGDTHDATPADVDHATAAVESITRFCVQADAEVDARLAIRGYALPQNATQFPVLAVWARAIARYHLNRSRDRTNEETGRIERDYRDALRALDQVAAGKLSLGAGDPLASAPAAAGAVQVRSEPPLFNRHTLEGL